MHIENQNATTYHGTRMGMIRETRTCGILMEVNESWHVLGMLLLQEPHVDPQMIRGRDVEIIVGDLIFTCIHTCIQSSISQWKINRVDDVFQPGSLYQIGF
jgi:hypothetical protein